MRIEFEKNCFFWKIWKKHFSENCEKLFSRFSQGGQLLCKFGYTQFYFEFQLFAETFALFLNFKIFYVSLTKKNRLSMQPSYKLNDFPMVVLENEDESAEFWPVQPWNNKKKEERVQRCFNIFCPVKVSRIEQSFLY